MLVRVLALNVTRRASILPTRLPVPSLWPSIAVFILTVLVAMLVRSIASDIALASPVTTTRHTLAAIAGGVCAGIFIVVTVMSTIFGLS